jgi:hypothetical protein
VVKESAYDWQKALDDTGTVVIRSRRHTAVWTLLGCVAAMAIGVALMFAGGIAGIVVGLVMIIGAAGFGRARVQGAVLAGEPHLVVTPDRVAYGRHSVPWSAVREVVRHTMTVRGSIDTYIWILHGDRQRLRLPETLQADMDELERWLRDVHARRGRAPS